MIRVGAAAALVLVLFLSFGCKDEATETQATGVNLNFENCLTFVAWVWIDGDYFASYTSEQTSFLPIGAGAHTLYARSNVIAGDSFVCWTKEFSVVDQQATELVLDCAGAGCH